MGRGLALLALGWLCLLLQASLASTLALDLASPDAALAVIVFAALHLRAPRAAAVALGIGYLGDLFAGSPRGLEATAAVGVCLLAQGAATRLLVRGRLFVALFVGGASLVKSLLVVALSGLMLRADALAPSMGEALSGAPTQALASALAAPVVFALARRIDRRLAPRRSALALDLTEAPGP